MKSFFEQNGGTYTNVGDYYIPNLEVPENHYEIRKYGRLRKKYLKDHHNLLYFSMLMQGTLLKYLTEIDETCRSTLKDMMSKMTE